MRHYLILPSFLVLMLCNACKENHQTNSEISIEKGVKLDSLEQLRLEEKNILDRFVNYDFKLDELTDTHPNYPNIRYFDTLHGTYPHNTEFFQQVEFIERIHAFTVDGYDEINLIHNNTVETPIHIKANFLSFFVGEAHNVSYNNYNLLYDMDRDIYAIDHVTYDYDTDTYQSKLYVEKPNHYTEEEFTKLIHWVNKDD